MSIIFFLNVDGVLNIEWPTIVVGIELIEGLDDRLPQEIQVV